MTLIKQKNIDNAVVSTMHDSSYSDPITNTDFYGGGSKDTDGATGFVNSNTVDFAKWHKYYIDVPIFATIIDTLALYAVGKGYKTDETTKEKLMKIKGWGKDDFNSIIENLTRVSLLCGDSMGEIIKDKASRLINLKPLNTGKIKILVNGKGILKKYEQTNSTKKTENFKPKEMFHLCWNRLGDEIHGKPYAERVEPLIKQIKQLTDDLGLRFHRIVKPVRLFETESNDPDKLATAEENLKEGYKNCEFIVIPKGTLSAVDVATIPDANDAIAYLNNLMRQLISACGVPEVILGWSSGTTDASAKIVYLSFQQRIERIQLFLEKQIKAQLGLDLDFEFPASLEPAVSAAGDPVQAPKNTPPSDDEKKAGKLNNVMKK